jgi:hypothetical protein
MSLVFSLSKYVRGHRYPDSGSDGGLIHVEALCTYLCMCWVFRDTFRELQSFQPEFAQSDIRTDVERITNCHGM